MSYDGVHAVHGAAGPDGDAAVRLEADGRRHARFPTDATVAHFSPQAHVIRPREELRIRSRVGKVETGHCTG